MIETARAALERLIALGRVILAAGLLLTALLLPGLDFPAYRLYVFTFGVYLAYALAWLVFLHRSAELRWAPWALVGDVVVLSLLLLAATFMPIGTLYFVLFLSGVAGLRRGWLSAVLLSLGISALYVVSVLRTATWQDPATWLSYLSQERLAVLGSLIAGGGLIGYLAQRERRSLELRAESASFAALLRLDADWDEVWRRWLAALCERFRARRCLLVQRDAETDRVRVWRYARGTAGDAYREEDRPPRDAAMFLVSDTQSSFLAQVTGSARTAVTVREGSSGQPASPPELPVRFLEEFQPRSVLSVALPESGGAASRLWLLDAEGGAFSVEQFDALEQLLGALSPVLANLLMVRRLIGQAQNAERERIGRDLHDGVAQTVASLEMQLQVLVREARQNGALLGEELAHLHEIVRTEKENLRGYLRRLKAVHVAPQELANWILAHCVQWQQETGIQVDVLVEPVGPSLPEGVCREVFLILREALHNVCKHASARHVLVKLRQDEGYLRVLVDDDGRGFSFTGSYSQHALKELGLGPVSICERAEALGATVTIDSTPGSGSTLRVDIPLN